MRYVLESGCEPVPESGVGVGRDMDQHACRGGQLDARADDECEERPESHEESLRNVAPVVEQFAQHGARERAEDYGIDLSLLEANLALTPEERLRQNDRVLNEALALQAALARSRARTRPPQ